MLDTSDRGDEIVRLTAAFFVAVVNAVVHAVAARPQGDTAVVCLAGKLSFLIALVIWTPWMRRQQKEGEKSRRARCE